jgi:soluble lytic murein transglycosylase-like protein
VGPDEPVEADLARAESTGVLRAMRQARRGAEVDPRVARAIVREADRHGLDPLLVAAVIQHESGFLQQARSPAGALGLMQIMPSTGRQLLTGMGRPPPADAHLLDVDLNVELGTCYLSWLVLRFGSLPEALVAYNHGPAAAARLLKDEGRRERLLAGYPRRVLDSYARFKAQPTEGQTR